MCAARAIPESLLTVGDTAKSAILRLLAERSARPTELLGRLGDEFTDFELKEALLGLLQEGSVAMGSDRTLKLA